MAREESLIVKIHFQAVYTEVARTVGYTGFRFEDLAEKLASLVKEHGAKAVSIVLSELVCIPACRVMLRPEVRRLCYLLLGPEPETGDELCRDSKGDPTEGPPGGEKPPEYEHGEPDDFVIGLLPLALPKLEEQLEKSAKAGNLHQVRCVRSELLRRGVDALEAGLEQPK